jgi:hypothetical protein
MKLKTIIVLALSIVLASVAFASPTAPEWITNTFPYLAYAQGDNSMSNVMPKIIFWILLILWAIGTFPNWNNPNVVRATGVIQIILFGILGYYTFRF